MFHVTADNAFPTGCAADNKESGSACVPPAVPTARFTFRDWHRRQWRSTDYAAPDPLDPDVVTAERSPLDRRTQQVQEIAPVPLRTNPGYPVSARSGALFGRTDARTLYFASNTVWKDPRRRARLAGRSART